MSIYKVTDKQAIAPLFDGWDETMIWSCLHDCMGEAYTDNPDAPISAQIVTGPFCCFAGQVSTELIGNHLDFSFFMTPQNQLWANAIEEFYGDKVARRTRYATKKVSDGFNIEHLKLLAASLPADYELRQIDAEIYEQVMNLPWARDFCSNFKDSGDFIKNGLGFVALKGADIVAGASSFTYYRGGIEIEIDTRVDERRKGLAAACAAKLILACLERGLYPSWDAHNAVSLALSKKLGYIFDREYPVYEFTEHQFI